MKGLNKRRAAVFSASFLLCSSSGPLLSVVSARSLVENLHVSPPRLRARSSFSQHSIRGGQNPSLYPQQKVPPRTQGWPGQQSSKAKSNKKTGIFGTDEAEHVESDAATREVIDGFLTRDSRNSFIARVYSIMSVQLVVTAISCLLFGLNPTLSSLSQLSRTGHPSAVAAKAIPLLGLFASTIAWFRVCSSPDARRKSPNKWWWLAIFTAGESLTVGFISSLYKFRSVVSAMGATALAASAVSLYTIKQNNPNRDLSQIGASLSSWAMILLTYLMIGMLQQSGVLPQGFLPFSDMLYSGFAACLFSAFLAYDTKLIVAGKHTKYRMNEQDYVYGAMALYSDVVGIFLNMLQMLGDERDR